MVSSDEQVWRELFPELYRETYVAYADCQISYSTTALRHGLVDDSLVARLHLVAITPDDLVVVCRGEQGGRFLPGGTREPGESLIDLARRELCEEAGVELLGTPHLFSAHVADSNRGEPYRHHLPHPRSLWAYAVARVRPDGVPTNPDDGEVVVEVLTLSPEEAADYLQVEDPIHADVLRHASAMGLLG